MPKRDPLTNKSRCANETATVFSSVHPKDTPRVTRVGEGGRLSARIMRVGAKMHASSSRIFSGDGESESIFNDLHVRCKPTERAMRTDVEERTVLV